MATATLDDYLAFNDQLAALAAAGVPLDVDLATAHKNPAAALERINATVARRVNRGESLSEAIQGDDEDLPPSYRSLVQVGLHEGNLTAALDDSNAVAESVVDTRTGLASGLVYPLVVCVFAYFGLLSLCLYFEPTLQNLYTELRLQPGTGLRVLEALRATLPYWSILAPLLLVAFAVWSLRSKRWRGTFGIGTSGLLRWFPGMSKSLFQERCARFAATLSELLDDGVSLAESLRIAGDGCGDLQLRAAASRLATSTEVGRLPEDESAAAMRFPPFLQWAIWHSEESTGRVKALDIAARMYRETAQRRAERFRAVAPVVALVVFGGTVTLIYGLLLFVPLVQLLYGLSAAPQV
jgi:type II secretory pathway component PulF